MIPVHPAGPRHPSEYDCQSCGACCDLPRDTFLLDDYVKVFEPEAGRLPPDLVIPPRDPLRTPVPGLRVVGQLRFEDHPLGTRCAALVGSRAEGHTACSIYESRPSECRAFTPGCATCTLIRKAAGLDPPTTPTNGGPCGDSTHVDTPDL